MEKYRNSVAYNASSRGPNLSSFPFSPPPPPTVQSRFSTKPSPTQPSEYDLADIPMIQYSVRPELFELSHSSTVVTREDIPMKTLNDLAMMANSHKLPQTITINQPPVSVPHRQQQATVTQGEENLHSHQTIESLKRELRQTQNELINAVKGWREEREAWQKKSEPKILSKEVKRAKAGFNTEKSQYRSRIAKLELSVSKLENEKQELIEDYDHKLQTVNSKLIIAESQLNNKTKVIVTHTPAPVPLSMVETLRVKDQEIEMLKRVKDQEIEMLKSELNRKFIHHPTRAPPPPPPEGIYTQEGGGASEPLELPSGGEFDFEAMSRSVF